MKIEREDHRSGVADHAEYPAIPFVRLRWIGPPDLVDGSQDFPLRGGEFSYFQPLLVKDAVVPVCEMEEDPHDRSACQDIPMDEVRLPGSAGTRSTEPGLQTACEGRSRC